MGHAQAYGTMAFVYISALQHKHEHLVCNVLSESESIDIGEDQAIKELMVEKYGVDEDLAKKIYDIVGGRLSDNT